MARSANVISIAVVSIGQADESRQALSIVHSPQVVPSLMCCRDWESWDWSGGPFHPACSVSLIPDRASELLAERDGLE
jgi:hypothetical protein